MTTTAGPQTNVTQLEPYIFFYGRCEEALEFYKNVFGGSYELQRNSDSPMGENVPAELRDKIMHATFKAPGISFMGSDGGQIKTIDPEAGNISLSLGAPTREEGKRIFDGLAQGGEIKAPFADAPWGGQFGNINDRFGNEWMIVAP